MSLRLQAQSGRAYRSSADTAAVLLTQPLASISLNHLEAPSPALESKVRAQERRIQELENANRKLVAASGPKAKPEAEGGPETTRERAMNGDENLTEAATRMLKRTPASSRRPSGYVRDGLPAVPPVPLVRLYSPASPVEHSIWRSDALREPLLLSIQRSQPDGIRVQSLKTLLNLGHQNKLRRGMWQDTWLREELVGALGAGQSPRVRELALNVCMILAKSEANQRDMACADGRGLRRALLGVCAADDEYTAKNHALALYVFTLIASSGDSDEGDGEPLSAELLWADGRIVDMVVAAVNVNEPIDVQEQALRLFLTLAQNETLQCGIWEHNGARVALLLAASDLGEPSGTPLDASPSDNRSDCSLEISMLPCPATRTLALRCFSRIVLSTESVQESFVADRAALETALAAAAAGQHDTTRELGVKILSRAFGRATASIIRSLREHTEVLEVLGAAVFANIQDASSARRDLKASVKEAASVPGASNVTLATSTTALKFLIKCSCVPELQVFIWERLESRASLVASAGEAAPLALRLHSLRALANLTCMESNVVAMWRHGSLREALVANVVIFNALVSEKFHEEPEAYAQHADCCCHALRALANLATFEEVQEEMLATCPVINALVASGQVPDQQHDPSDTHEVAARVQTLRALANLACAPLARKVLWKHAGLRLTISHNTRLEQPAEVREQALRIMANLTSMDEDLEA